MGVFFFFQAEDGIRDWSVTGVQTCALPICPDGCERRSPASCGAALERRNVALLWSRPLVVLVLFAVTMFSGLGRGKGGSVSEGRSEEETTSGDGPRVPIPGSGSGLFKADSGEFQAVVIPYGTSQARIKKEGGEQEVGLFIPGMEGTLTVLDETGEKVDSGHCSSTAASSTIPP